MSIRLKYYMLDIFATLSNETNTFVDVIVYLYECLG